MTADLMPVVTAEQARTLTDRIKVGVEGIWHLITEAYNSRAYTALGYVNWDDYCVREFGTSRLRLPREERSEVVASLRDSGLSVRAIAAATGDHFSTVSRTLRRVADATPEPVEEDPEPDDEPALTEEECEALDQSRADFEDDEDEPDDEELSPAATAAKPPELRLITGRDGKKYSPPPPKPQLTEAERIAQRDEQERKAGVRRQLGWLLAFLAGWDCATRLRKNPWRDELLNSMDEYDRIRFLAIEKDLP